MLSVINVTRLYAHKNLDLSLMVVETTNLMLMEIKSLLVIVMVQAVYLVYFLRIQFALQISNVWLELLSWLSMRHQRLIKTDSVVL